MHFFELLKICHVLNWDLESVTRLLQVTWNRQFSCNFGYFRNNLFSFHCCLSRSASFCHQFKKKSENKWKKFRGIKSTNFREDFSRQSEMKFSIWNHGWKLVGTNFSNLPGDRSDQKADRNSSEKFLWIQNSWADQWEIRQANRHLFNQCGWSAVLFEVLGYHPKTWEIAWRSLETMRWVIEQFQMQLSIPISEARSSFNEVIHVTFYHYSL